MSSVPLFWCCNCICRTLRHISMKNFWGSSTDKMIHKKKIWWRHRSGDSAAMLFLKRKPSKIFFSEVVVQIKAKLYTYNHLSMRNKRFTHMTSQVTWFGSHIGFTIKPIKSSPERLNRSRGNFTKMFSKPLVYKIVME